MAGSDWADSSTPSVRPEVEGFGEAKRESEVLLVARLAATGSTVSPRLASLDCALLPRTEPPPSVAMLLRFKAAVAVSPPSFSEPPIKPGVEDCNCRFGGKVSRPRYEMVLGVWCRVGELGCPKCNSEEGMRTAASESSEYCDQITRCKSI